MQGNKDNYVKNEKPQPKLKIDHAPKPLRR